MLLDEADSIFINRENAQRSWEITQTNELLTQMNTFNGILICCTNLLHIIDHAAMRRFDWKIEFKPLTNEGRLRVYRKYFSIPGKRITGTVRKGLIGLENLTFGDIHAVWKKFRFAPKEDLDHNRLIESLKTEAKYQSNIVSKKLGFI